MTSGKATMYCPTNQRPGEQVTMTVRNLVPVRLSLRPTRSIEFGDVTRHTAASDHVTRKRLTEERYRDLETRLHRSREIQMRETGVTFLKFKILSKYSL